MNVTFIAPTDDWGDVLRTLGVPAEASSKTTTISAASWATIEVYDASEGAMMQTRGDLLAPGRYAATLRYVSAEDARLAASALTASGYTGVVVTSE